MKKIFILLLLLTSFFFLGCTEQKQILVVDKVFGEAWTHEEAGIVLPIAEADTYYTVDLNAGQLNGFAFQDNNLIAQHNGTYLINFSISFGGGGNNEYGIVAFVNETKQDNCYVHRKLGAAGDVGAAGDNCIIDINAGQYLTLRVEDETDPASDITVQSATITALKIK